MSLVWCLMLLLLAAGPALAQQLAFPTAEGYGRFALGGRGGTAIAVTRLDGNTTGYTPGNGSLRACLEATGPRTCIFRVGGIIDWSVEYPTVNPYLTIAGQTAPGGGILLKNMQLAVRNTHNIIVRHIRIRPGANNPQPYSFGSTEEYTSHDIIWDHVSLSWASDDMAGGFNNSYNVTYQWSIIAESLNQCACNPGQPSKALSTGYIQPTHGYSLLHNLFANINYRVPSIGDGSVQLVNNVFYNIGLYSQLYFVNTGRPYMRMSFINNYYRPGPLSAAPSSFGNAIWSYGCGADASTDCNKVQNSTLQLSGNFHTILRPNNTYAEDALMGRSPTGATNVPWSSAPISGFPTIPSTVAAVDALSPVLAQAGATKPVRDSVDTRQVTSVGNNTGTWPATETACGGYPTIASGTPYTDTDGDGMEDSWETAHGLNPASAADGPQLHANGYSNLENFLNERAGDVVFAATGPSITITAPRNTATFPTAATALTTLAGVASDDVGVTAVTWTCPTCTPTSEAATCPTCGPAATSVTWSIANLGLELGDNVLTVTATDGTETTVDSVTITRVAPVTAQRINAGGPLFVASDGTYQADQYSTGGTVYTSAAAIAGTTDDVLYQTERWGTYTYAIPVSNGAYTVTLKFAELFFSTAGNRLFHVDLNGARVLTNYDIATAAGGVNTAVDHTSLLTVTSGVVFIDLISVLTNAKIDALAIVPEVSAPGVIITWPTSAPTLSVGSTPLTNVAGTGVDNVGVTGVTWSCPTCTPTSGAATCPTCGASATSVTWSLASLGLAIGDNVLTVTATDGTQSSQATLTVTYTPPAVSATSGVAPAYTGYWAR